MMYRVAAFAILGSALVACGETATTADPGNNSAEFAQLSPENGQTGEMAGNSDQSSKRAAVQPSAKPGKKPAVPPGQDKVIKPSPLVAPAEIDPVPPPVEGTEPLNGN
jgi:hypothetical protein